MTNQTSDAPSSGPASTSSPPGQSPTAPTRKSLEDAEAALQRAAVIARDKAARRRAEAPTPLASGLAVPLDEWGVKAARCRAEAEKRDQDKEFRERSGVPARYQDATLADVALVPAEWLERYADAVRKLSVLLDRPGIIALLGPRGPGKTHMACGLIRAAFARGKSGRYVDAFDFFLTLRSTYRPHATFSEADAETLFLQPYLLIVDEAHERGETAWEDRMLTRLIRKRHDQRRPTVLISNQNPKTFTETIGASVIDRMNDDAGGIIECLWPSLRGVGAPEAINA